MDTPVVMLESITLVVIVALTNKVQSHETQLVEVLCIRFVNFILLGISNREEAINTPQSGCAEMHTHRTPETDCGSMAARREPRDRGSPGKTKVF